MPNLNPKTDSLQATPWSSWKCPPKKCSTKESKYMPTHTHTCTTSYVLCSFDLTTGETPPICWALPLNDYLTSKKLWAITDQRMDSCPRTKAGMSLWMDTCQSNCRAWPTAWFSEFLWLSNSFSCSPVGLSVLLNVIPCQFRLPTCRTQLEPLMATISFLPDG